MTRLQNSIFFFPPSQFNLFTELKIINCGEKALSVLGRVFEAEIFATETLFRVKMTQCVSEGLKLTELVEKVRVY